MAVTRSIGVKPVNDAGATPQDMKYTMSALMAQTAVNTPRVGVLSPTDTPLVSGTAGLDYMVGKCQVVLSPGQGYGAHIVTVLDPTAVSTVAGSASGIRIDLVTIRQQDPDVGDEANEPIIEVIQGDTVEANPVPPSSKVPPGALVLAQVRVPADMSATNQAGVVYTVTAPFTGLRGAAIGESAASLTTISGWNVYGFARKKQMPDGLFDVHLNGRFQRTGNPVTISNWTKLLTGVIPAAYRADRNPNGDVLLATGHTFTWFPTGDVASQPTMQLYADHLGDIWARSLGGNITIRQWGFINVGLDYLVSQ